MARKHTLPSDSDNDSSESNSSPKRAKLGEGESSPPPSSPPQPGPSRAGPSTNGRFSGINGSNGKNGNGHVNGPEDDSSGSDDLSEDEGEVDQAETDRRKTQLERIEKDSQAIGTVAQAGVIEEVKLIDFMCHRHCTVNFGPQINFLVGNNGSGKSAVLTGITMALGGNARATNRATKGSGFVREGASSATCTVRLRNKGEDAYLPHVYGDSITIERRIGGEGASSGYKIYNHERKIVDTRKSTLDAILDQMNIQVDNPMTVLTQDQSRQFLASATGKDKYNFFLRGTQLAALTDEYELIRLNTQTMDDTMHKKKEVLPELISAHRRAMARATEATAASGQQNKLQQLKHEYAWAFVVEMEDQIAQSEQVIDKAKRRQAKIEEAVVAAREKVAKANGRLADLQEAGAEGGGPETLEREVETAKQELKEFKLKMQEYHNQTRSTNNTVVRMKATIADYETKIADARRKLERNTQAEQQPVIERIAAIEEDLSRLGHELLKTRASFEDADETRRANNDKLTELRDSINRAAGDEEGFRRRIKELEGAGRDKIRTFGDTMPNIMRAIDQETGWQRKPIGPIGQHVSLPAEHRVYAGVLESFFSESLNAFLVDNERDKNLLNRILRQNRPNRGKVAPIIKQTHDPTFDFSRGVPQTDVLTIHRVLSFEGPHGKAVETALINSLHIEKAALVRARADGDALMRNKPFNVESCFSGDGYRLSFDGGSSSQTMNPWKGPRRLIQDVTEQVESAKAELASAGQARQRLVGLKQNLDKQMTDLHNASSAATEREAKLKKNMQNLNAEKLRLTDRLREEEPTNITSLEEAKADAQAELDSTVAQFMSLNEQKDETNRQAQPLTEKCARLSEELEQRRTLQSRINEKMNSALGHAQEEQRDLASLEAKLATQVAQVAVFEEQIEKYHAARVERIDQASHVCERPTVEKKRSVEKLEREIKLLERALADRELQHGASIDQIMDELAVRARTMNEAKVALRELEELCKLLTRAYDIRVAMWTEFRDQISARARDQFLFHLSKRGFAGRINFHHKKSRLDMRVQTEDVASTKAKTKDTKSLSGGEKSFSTICLLLTMWEAVGCPIRCLDEFDVFMDAVNRRISMTMLIATAKSANKTQHILISPNDLGSLSWGPEVRCIRMQDPGRSQGTLGFGVTA